MLLATYGSYRGCKGQWNRYFDFVYVAAKREAALMRHELSLKVKSTNTVTKWFILYHHIQFSYLYLPFWLTKKDLTYEGFFYNHLWDAYAFTFHLTSTILSYFPHASGNVETYWINFGFGCSEKLLSLAVQCDNWDSITTTAFYRKQTAIQKTKDTTKIPIRQHFRLKEFR